MLFICISLENEDPEAVYKTIRKELTDYDAELAKKKELIILTKTDTTTPEKIEEIKKRISKLNSEILSVTILDDSSVKALKDSIIKLLR